jgi:hypothetical protein
MPGLGIAAHHRLVVDCLFGSNCVGDLVDHHELVQLVPFDDFNDPFAGGGGSLGGTRALIASICENTLDERK